MIKNSRNPQVLLSLISGIILIIIHSIALAQSPNQPEKNQTLGPAQVTPPAIDLEEEVAPEQTELQQSSETEDVSESADFSNQQEPLPQIKRTKDYIDPRYRPESRYIEHPNASKGLIKIDKEKVYHYKVQTSPQKNSSALKLGYYDPTELVNPNDSTLRFEDLYDENYPLILYDHDWEFSQKFGILAWKVGGGFYFAQGHGRFAANAGGYNQTLTPREKFSFLAFPLNAGVSYKLKYFKNQWLVPYVEGAVDAFCFAEYRDDGNNPSLGMKLGLAPAGHASAGLSLALGKDARSFLDLDREYGINAVYITAEYRRYFALSDKYDFSGDAISGGITAEY